MILPFILWLAFTVVLGVALCRVAALPMPRPALTGTFDNIDHVMVRQTINRSRGCVLRET
jgi:hypothetical protein